MNLDRNFVDEHGYLRLVALAGAAVFLAVSYLAFRSGPRA